MITVTAQLSHAIKAAGDLGKLKDPIPSLLIKARGRIEFLEAQLADTETMRDRIAVQLLPGVLADRDLRYSDDMAVAYAYELADQVLAFRKAEVTPETVEEEEFGTQFRVGEKVRVKSTGIEGTVDEFIAQHEDYTMVNFRGSGGAPTVCSTADLERVNPQ